MATALRAWYRDDSDENLEEPHMTDPAEMITSPEQLLRESGVKYWRVENCNDQEVQKKLGEGYIATDFMEFTRQFLGDEYEEKLKLFYTEHLHEDSEIRLILEGGGFFEVRSYDDRWIRLHLREGDLINLPPGIYHRLTFDKQRHVRMLRLFSEVPHWIAFFRPDGDTHPARTKYFETRIQNNPIAVA